MTHFSEETLPPHTKVEWRFNTQRKPLITAVQFHGGRFTVNYERATGGPDRDGLEPMTWRLGSALVLGAVGLSQGKAARCEEIDSETVKKRRSDLFRFFSIPVGGRSLNLSVARAHEEDILEWTDPIQTSPSHKEQADEFFATYGAALEDGQRIEAICSRLSEGSGANVRRGSVDQDFRDFCKSMELSNITAAILYRHGLGKGDSELPSTTPQQPALPLGISFASGEPSWSP